MSIIIVINVYSLFEGQVDNRSLSGRFSSFYTNNIRSCVFPGVFQDFWVQNVTKVCINGIFVNLKREPLAKNCAYWSII